MVHYKVNTSNIEDMMNKVVSISKGINSIRIAISLSAENMIIISDFKASLILKKVFRSPLVGIVCGL